MYPQDTPDETWRLLPMWEDRYAVSTRGRVWSLRASKPLAAHPNNGGYLMVCLKNAARQTHTKTVHSLIARTFMLPVPIGHEIDHVDGDKSNNALTNLEWVTRSENHRRAYALGLRRYTSRNHSKGEHRPLAKLTAGKVREIRATPHFVGINEHFAAKFGVSFQTISAVRHGVLWKHVK